MQVLHDILDGSRTAPPSIESGRAPVPEGALPWDGPASTPLYTLTLSQVMDQPDAPEAQSREWERHVRNGWPSLNRVLGRQDLARNAAGCDVVGYGIWYDIDGHAVVAVEAATGEPAGGIVGGNLHVFAPHRRKGLAAALTEVAFDVGLKRVSSRVTLSPGGRAARRSAHRRSVERALVAGVPVRAEVLADYPDLDDASAVPRA